MNDVVSGLKQQASRTGFADAFTRRVAKTVAEVSAYFDRETPGLDMHYELCEDGVIMTCEERCLGLTGTIKRDGELTLTFPAGKNLEHVILAESAFQSRKPVLEGAAKWVRLRLESAN